MLGHLLSVVITPANEQEWAQVGELCRQVQEVIGQTVQISFGDQGYVGEEVEYEAAVHAIDLQVVKNYEAKLSLFLSRRRPSIRAAPVANRLPYQPRWVGPGHEQRLHRTVLANG